MARRCEITGTGVMTGNNVSHANNRTRRRFLPNIQKTSFLSEVLGRTVQLKLTPRAIRTIEINGGLDAFLEKTSKSKLPVEGRALKLQIAKAAAKKA